MNIITDLLPNNGLNPIEYVVILAYLLLMVFVGILFKSFSGNISDFFRGGCRATWWLVGMNAFMSSFSAWTFTGAAGVAFESGWSVLVIFLAHASGFLLNFLCCRPLVPPTERYHNPRGEWRALQQRERGRFYSFLSPDQRLAGGLVSYFME
jgi:Na+/proline symporter